MMRVTLLTNLSGGNTAIKISGLSRYSLSLHKELDKNKALQVKLLMQEKLPKPILFFANVLGTLLGKDIETFFRAIPLFFPKDVGEDADIIHCTSQLLALPLLYNKQLRKKCVVTVHDIIPVATNTYASAAEKFFYGLLLKALKNTAHIIADSEQTKKDIVTYVGYPEEKISVISLGIDPKEFSEKKIKRNKETILYVGSEHKRKNIECIIKALALVKKEIPNILFMKVGQAQDNYNREKLKALARESGVEENILWKDYVGDLAEEYNKATVFVFPSVYEGFGFPVLEAMACGCPVISSDKTSLPELAGDAAVYCDVCDEGELAEKIIRVIKNKRVQESLRKKGLLQAKKFTWKKCAEETIDIYKKISSN